MKSIKTYLFGVAALAAVLAVASCDNGNKEPAVVATYAASEAGSSMELTFLDDDSFTLDMKSNGQEAVLNGTYTGKADADGDVTLTTTGGKSAGQDLPEALAKEAADVYIGQDGKVKISDGGKKAKLASGVVLDRK